MPTDPDGRPVVIGRRIEVNPEEAAVINRIFEWAADGAGLVRICERLTAEGIPGTTGRHWHKTPIHRILNNERYRGFQIWGQKAVEREPSTGRKIMRPRPRSEWKIVERPDLRIVSEELWARAHKTRQEVREAVAPKRQLARRTSGKHHSPHLLTGFCTCAVCGGAISCVSGGKGSPRLGCRRSWQQGLSACSNRWTIRVKVAEPIILARLQAELSKPATAAYLLRETEKGLAQATAKAADAGRLTKQLEQEQRKLRNLVAAIEAGNDSPAVVMRAIAAKEAVIGDLEGQLATAREQPPAREIRDLPQRISRLLGSLSTVLKGDDPQRVKAALRDLNFSLKFIPTEAEPRAYFAVEAQCDLFALGSFYVRLTVAQMVAVAKGTQGGGWPGHLGAPVALLGEQAAAITTARRTNRRCRWTGKRSRSAPRFY